MAKRRGIKEAHGPEWYIQRDLMKYLRLRKWLVERTHGNVYQQGFPDLYIAHPQYGQRCVDVKNPKRYTLTKAQRKKWPLWDQFKIPIYILTGANKAEYDKLFAPPNWRDYYKGPGPDIDKMLDELCNS